MTWGAACVVLGLALLIASGVAGAVLPWELGEERAYLVAEPCPEQSADDYSCLRMFPAKVRETERHASRSGATYDVVLESSAGWSGTVPGFGAKPLVERLRAGDEVTVSSWRGEVTALGRDGVTQRASGTPDYGPQILTVMAMEAVVLAGWLLFAGLHAVRRAGRMATQGVRAVLPPLLLPIMTTALLPLLPTLLTRDGDGALPVIVTIAAWICLEALALWLLRGRLRVTRA